MIAPAGSVDGIAAALHANGLVLRGGFNFTPGDASTTGPSGGAAAAVLLVGQAGAAPLPHFLRWWEQQPQAIANPLDTWSREVIGSVAETFRARAVSPSDTPYLPFQQWAMRAEGLKPSPLGILMHPHYGLWHAYRGALLFDDELPIQAGEAAPHLCDSCVEKPCLKSCPVDAYSAQGFAYQSCLAHVRGASGEPCRNGGCLDRNACPYGTEYRYPPEVQAFHMASFARATN
ncbi:MULTISPECIES: 4Fe-4S dicluster domain-containing protein [unclassified Mesorhizobium]|uniref:4Fe-4S dicluster domain-containing protein n=1 Tax=unclassified Mesorhizobium TaxID=325217 RepID=UPI000FCCAF6B|nr:MULTISPECIES: 4Fe-4S dicluster domain-containing protein [unclassified Mesorhizobium]RUU64275.1 4Fe-4S dicluster domain-containing protein [Mesorhizobium sp. M7A.T.Ca.TU.009.01.1.1]RUU85327.1 4Fe-4S dicluster domain-containing protein [Mesorhizobium sp. M7A.T.Ca.TU.009.01.1.2]RWN11376.1 MAG: 4Fe-4S dicluster domain-containing protein [Mesorhizobium sp.]RUT82860.1 4Fe-4S dicluster domain-containing protein [Mesorhizobium sp. M7A.T.Ca.US.000.02.2.1]RUT83521.1 4Fe-4S dicluster domain-containin